jgi:hypothetical protein
VRWQEFSSTVVRCRSVPRQAVSSRPPSRV